MKEIIKLAREIKSIEQDKVVFKYSIEEIYNEFYGKYKDMKVCVEENTPVDKKFMRQQLATLPNLTIPGSVKEQPVNGKLLKPYKQIFEKRMEKKNGKKPNRNNKNEK